MDNSLFEVERERYSSFVHQLTKGAGEVRTEEEGESIFYKIYSAKTGVCWCGRLVTPNQPEKYFIFNFPEEGEWGPPVITHHVVLETKEQVQKFLDGCRKLRNEGNL